MNWPTARIFPRSLSDAYADERAYCIEGPNGQRTSFVINNQRGLLQRISNWFWGIA